MDSSTWHLAAAKDLKALKNFFDLKPPEKLATFLLTKQTNISGIDAITEELCPGCKAQILNSEAQIDQITAAVSRSAALVCDSPNSLGWGFLLDDSSSLALIGNPGPAQSWIPELQTLLGLQIRIFANPKS
jgi:hypothetical protein